MSSENHCFCELAPLYALDQLDEIEKSWVQGQIDDCPDLAEALTAYQIAVTAIPYSAPSLPVAADVKQRLFDRLNLDLPDSDTIFDCPPSSWLAVRSQDLHWQPHTAPGFVVAIVHRDEMKRELVGFLRAEPGAHYPFHCHAAIEEIFMLEGDLVIGNQVYEAGDYIRSYPRSSHAPYSNGGCRFFFHASMDDDYPELIESSR